MGDFGHERGRGQFTIEPASDEMKQWGAKQCVVISETGGVPEVLDIVSKCRDNDARIDNSGEEAGDDEFLVRFPGSEQQLYTHDQLIQRLRSIENGNDPE